MRWRMGRLYGSNTSTGCSAVIFDCAIGVWCSYDLGMESINNTRFTITRLHLHSSKQPGVPAERHDRPEHDPVLVGQHRLHQDRRLEQCQSEDRRAWRYLRVRLFSHSFFCFTSLYSIPICSFSLPKCLGREGLLDARPEMRATFLPTPLLSLLVPFVPKASFFPVPRAFPPFGLLPPSHHYFGCGTQRSEACAQEHSPVSCFFAS